MGTARIISIIGIVIVVDNLSKIIATAVLAGIAHCRSACLPSPPLVEVLLSLDELDQIDAGVQFGVTMPPGYQASGMELVRQERCRPGIGVGGREDEGKRRKVCQVITGKGKAVR